MVEQRVPGIQPAEIKSSENRERLSNEEMGNLLAAFGNSETKALTILLMRPEIIYTSSDLLRAIMNVQGENPAWKMGNTLPFAYCEKSLSPIGLVAREVVDERHQSYGYIKTPYGKNVGDPLAGLLLDFSARHRVSLYQLFGPTQYPGSQESAKRSPSTRLKIYSFLLKADLPVRTIDLGRWMNEPSRHIAQKHIEVVARSGIIDYQAINPASSVTFYKMSSKPAESFPTVSSSVTLTKQIYELLSEDKNKYWSLDEIMKRGKHTRGVYAQVSRVLKGLKALGYVEVEKFSHGKNSEINLSEEQRKLLSELVTLIKGFQNQDQEVIERGKILAGKFASGAAPINLIVEKARENSPMSHRTSPEVTGQLIISIIYQNPGITAAKIRELLEKNHSRRLSKESVWSTLNYLNNQKLVRNINRETNKKNISSWEVNSEEG